MLRSIGKQSGKSVESVLSFYNAVFWASFSEVDKNHNVGLIDYLHIC